MARDYAEAIAYVYGLAPRGVDLGLGRVRRSLAALGDPQRALRIVHIAGTNGKGSVAALLESMLRASGMRTGLYTSPHLHRFAERIRIDGVPIDDDALVAAVERLRATEGSTELTFFEAATVLALDAFRHARCDVVILEVGLGGRLDATNVVDAELAVVTNVALDHTAILGSTHEAIAAEKAAIAKPGRILVSGIDHAGAREVARAVAASHGARLVELSADARLSGDRVEGLTLATSEDAITGVPWVLRGEHQRRNLAVALLAVLCLRRLGHVLPDEAIRRGASQVRWPARLELLAGSPPMLLDGAHNPEGCEALASELASLPREGPRILVFGAMSDKRIDAMLLAFDGLVDERVYVAVPLPRAAPPESLAALAPGRVAESVESGVELAERLAGASGLVVVAGSLFVVAAARARRLGLSVDPPIAM